MTRVQREIVIDAPVERVFARLADPVRAKEDVPGLLEVKDLTGSGRGQRYRCVYRLAGRRFEQANEVAEFVPDRRIANRFSGLLNGTSTLTLEPLENGSRTRLRFVADYSTSLPVLGRFAESAVRRPYETAVDASLANLKANVEGRGRDSPADRSPDASASPVTRPR